MTKMFLAGEGYTENIMLKESFCRGKVIPGEFFLLTPGVLSKFQRQHQGGFDPQKKRYRP